MSRPSPNLNKTRRTDQLIVLAAIIFLVVGAFLVLRPFLSALLWAVVLSFSSWPAYRWLLRWMGGRRTLAASLMTLAITAVLLVPTITIVVTLADNVKQFGSATAAWLRNGPPPPPEWLARVPVVGDDLESIWTNYAGDSAALLAALEPLLEPLTTGLLTVGKAVGRGALELSLSIFLAFFFFRDGAVLGERAMAISHRLAGDHGDHLLLEVAGGTVRSVVYGILGTAVVQGLCAGTGFLIAGVPAPVLLGVLTFFVSVIPMGPPLVWVTASVWLFQTKSAGWGIFMLLWGALVISSIDNLVRPLIISQGNKMPFVLIFMGVLGGALAFGFIGVFLGPTLLAVIFRLVEEWVAYRQKVTPAAQSGEEDAEMEAGAGGAAGAFALAEDPAPAEAGERT